MQHAFLCTLLHKKLTYFQVRLFFKNWNCKILCKKESAFLKESIDIKSKLYIIYI